MNIDLQPATYLAPALPKPPVNTTYTAASLTALGKFVALGSVLALLLSAFGSERWWLRILIVTIGGLAVDRFAARRPVEGDRVKVTGSTPSDATAGVPSVLWLSVSAPRTPLTVAIGVLRVLRRLAGTEEGAVEVTYLWRGRVTDLEATVSHTGPLGLFRATYHTRVVLPHALFVAPQPEMPREGFRPPRARSNGLDSVIDRSGPPDLLRGARPYRPGDRMHHIHWPATARGTGTLMVREFDALRSRRLIVVVDLGPQQFPGDVERVARHAHWLCQEALRQQFDLELVTVANYQTIWAGVPTTTEAARRLTDATSGAPAVQFERRNDGLFVLGNHGRRPLPCLWVCPAGVFS